jgi:RNA polymerase sigma factor (sigma-70 family)
MDWDQIYCRLTSDDNDSLAWAALQRRVEVWARAVFWMQARHLIDDAVVDTCAGIALGLQAARGPATFAGFAYGHFLNARRRLLRVEVQPSVPIDDLDVAAPPREEGPDVEAISSLRRALATLPPRERTAVTLRYFHDFPSSRIATELGVTNGNARRILFNGLRRLRAQLRTRPWLTEPTNFRRPVVASGAGRAR